MKTALSANEVAAALIPDGAVCLIGGFMGVGSPHRLIDAMVKRGIKNLTIVANDTAMPGRGIGKLIVGDAVKSSSPRTSDSTRRPREDDSGEIEVELSPQGTLIERIRAGGMGLGGVLTATGIGTTVEKASRLEIDGKHYLLEMPHHGAISLSSAASRPTTTAISDTRSPPTISTPSWRSRGTW